MHLVLLPGRKSFTIKYTDVQEKKMKILRGAMWDEMLLPSLEPYVDPLHLRLLLHLLLLLSDCAACAADEVAIAGHCWCAAAPAISVRPILFVGLFKYRIKKQKKSARTKI